jgi:hypothetical protein
VQLRTSETYPDAGDGVVAKVDIPESTIFILMSGQILTPAGEKKYL